MTGSIFYFYGNSVTALGDWWVKSYTSSASNKVKTALRSLSRGQSGAAEAQLRSWQKFQPGDRLYPFKRQLFVEYAKYLHSRKSYAELADHAERWLKVDERDVTVRAYRANALRHVDGHEVEGKQFLVKLWSRFPKNTMVARFRAGIAAKDGDLETLRAIQKALEADWERPLSMNGWRLYWDTGRDFNELESGPARVEKHKGKWRLHGHVSSRAFRVRIDPPPHSILRMSKFSISLGDALENSTIRVVKEVQMIQRDGPWLQTTGGIDPYLILDTSDLAEKENAANTSTFISHFQAEPPRHEWFETLTARFDL